MYDRLTQHFAINGYQGHGSLMHRITLKVVPLS